MAISGPLAEMLERNKQHQESIKQPPPDLLTMSKYANQAGNGVFVISCSDPRLTPYRILGVDPADPRQPVMIRNAGGRVFDVGRSLAVLGRIGNPGTIVVMHHTDCGMTHFHDSAVREHLHSISPEAAETIDSVKTFGEITGPIEESIKGDVALLRESPFVRKGTQIVGLKYDVFTGKLEEIESWTR